MGHRKRIYLFCFIFIVAIVFFTPYLIRTTYVRSFITVQLSDRLNIQSDFKQISWSWIPVPHISITNASVADEKLSVKLSHAKIYPDWIGLLMGNPGIKKIELNAPEVYVKALHFSEKKKNKPRTLPSSLIIIRNCRIFLPPVAAAQKPTDPVPFLELSNIDATILLEQTGINIDIAWDPEFAKSLLIKCHYLPSRFNSNPGSDSKLKLNSEAIELDLTKVRENVLFLFGNNRTARRVCSIVRGGYAKIAGFSFEGNSKDIKKLQSITITADADKVAIDIPKLNLHIEDGSGHIKIQDGILSGQNLSARLGNSSGTNGAITLGLIGKDKVFKLEVDIDADISELPAVLHNVVRREKFRNELSNFSNTQGRASGRLILGDRLKDMSVEVEFSGAETYTDYQRLLFPIHINKAWLKILPRDKTIIWKEIKGSIGPHLIHHSAGSVQWKDGVLIDIEKHHATIDSNELFKELNSYPQLQKTLSKILVSIEGPLEINDLRLKGMAKDPLSWQYSTSINIKDLKFHSPFFLDAALVKSAFIQASQKNIQILQSLINLSEQPINFKGNFDHTNWHNWKGRLELNGVATRADGKWLKSKGWIPHLYFPYTPCELSPLEISFDGNRTVDIKGEIITEKYPHKPVRAKIAFTKSPGEISLKDLTITTSEEKSSFSIYANRSPDKSFLLDFKGFLNANTLTSLFEENRLLQGSISGACNLKYARDGLDPPQIHGQLEIADFSWEAGAGNKITIDYAKIDGHGSKADIDNLSLFLNKEALTATGQVSMTRSGVDLDLDVKSDALSWNNLSLFLRPTENRPAYRNTTPASHISAGSRPPGTSPALSDFTLTGSINFAVNEFVYTKTPKSPPAAVADKKSNDYIWHVLTGRINFLPDKNMSIPITSAEICGFETTGIIGFGPDHKNLFLSVRSKGEVSFQKVFSCLDIEFQKIEGPFTLNANLEGMPGKWKKGSIELNAKEGKIKGSTLLTRILSVVNVIDLFSKNAVQEFFSDGFFYSDMEFKGNVEDNILIIDKVKIKGNGMNLFGSGKIDLSKMDMDFAVLIAPFKVLDTTLSKLLSLGFIKENEDNVIITFPLSVKGSIKDPKVTPLPAHALGESLVNLAKSVLILPFKIFTR